MIRKILFLLFTISTLLLAGCSSDEPFSLPGADGRTTIELLIPSAEMARANTRAEGEETSTGSHGYRDRLADEAKIHRLAVIGFYNDEKAENKRKHFFAELTEDMSSEVEDVYRSYKLAVVPATYDLYIVANIPTSSIATLAKKEEKLTPTEVAQLEKDVKALVYEYNALPVVTGDNAPGLPMAKAISDQTVSENSNEQIVVDLEFVCAKVRLTVIYNDTEAMSIDQMDVCNPYSPTKVFLSGTQTHGTGSKMENNFTNAGSGVYYALTGSATPVGAETSKDLKDWTLDDWIKMQTDESTDPLNNFKTKDTEHKCYAWQNTVYVPEAVTSSNPTFLDLISSTLHAEIKIGCSSENATDHKEGGNLRRGHFYDIVAMVSPGKVTYDWKVTPWTNKGIEAELGGYSKLYVEKTDLGDVKGQDLIEFAYETDAPSLELQSCQVKKYGTMESDMDLFEVTEDPENGKIVVTVNPDLPVNKDVLYAADCVKGEMGFWVVAGTIRKWIKVKSVDLKPYLRLLPKDPVLMIRNIVNKGNDYVDFKYATNSTNLTLQLVKRINTNENKGCVDYDNPDATPKGTYIQVLHSDGTVLTSKIPINDNTLDLEETNNLFKKDNVTSIPKDGIIRVMFNSPADATYYSKEIILGFKGTACECDDATTELKVVPNPLVYTIHFKAINDGTWDQPHIYVYQPLLYNGLEVYGTSGDKNINWIEYSFTGQMAFRGWVKDGGAVPNITATASNFNDGGGSPVHGFHIGSTWGDPGRDYKGDDSYNAYESVSENPADDDKYMKVKLVDLTDSSCDQCKATSSNPMGSPNKIWPGCGMIDEGDGWYKIELPLLAKPGSAYVMFNNGHGGSAQRYPEAGVPGVVLPDYTDREAWYLYDGDRGGDLCSFSDDRRTSYPEAPKITRKYRLYWYKGDPWYWKIEIYNAANSNMLFSEYSNVGSMKPCHNNNDMYYYDFEITDTEGRIKKMSIIPQFGTDSGVWYRKNYDNGKIPLDGSWWHYNEVIQRYVYGDQSGQLGSGDITQK